MKVFVYGAGVIGCYLTHILMQAENDVTLLARGEWKDNLIQNGLTIRHSLQRKTTIDHPRIVSKVNDEAYDVAFAVMQHQQMWNILDDLSSIHAPIVVLVGNNLAAPDMEHYIVTRSNPKKTVLFGFQATGGRREDGKVICARIGNGSMSIGALHCEASDENKAKIAALFKGTKYKLEWMSNMDAWYRCHLAFILPVCYLCYSTGCNLRKSTKQQRRQVLDASVEGYKLLMTLHYPILPEGDEKYCEPGIKQKLTQVMMFLMAKTAIGDLAASDHCRHAVTEMESIDKAWAKMRQKKAGFPMPNWDALRNTMPAWQDLHKVYDHK